MATIGWAVEADGDWRTRTDWSTGNLPGSSDNVVLNTTGAWTITQSTSADSAASITATTDQLAVSGGSLRVSGAASLGAGLAISGGTLVLSGGGGISGGLVATGGSLYLGSGATTSVTGAASFSGQFDLTGLGTLSTGGVTTVGALLFGAGVTWSNAGTATIAGEVQSTAAAHIINTAGASFDLIADAAGLIQTGGAQTFANAGTLAKTGGDGTSEIDSTLTSTGTIAVDSGTLQLTTGGTIGGALAGPGTLELGAASSTTLASLAATDGGELLSTGLLTIAAAGAAVGADLTQKGGTLSLATGATLTTGAGLDLEGGAIVTGLATLATDGVTTVGDDGHAVSLRGGMTWDNAGTVTVDSSIQTLNLTTLENAAGGVFALAADAAGIIADGGNSRFNNAGTLAKTGGDDVSEIDSTLTSTGAIAVDSGTLLLTAGGTIGGALAGPGTLELGTASVTGLASLSATGGGEVLSTGLLTVAASGAQTNVELAQQGGTISLSTGATLTTTGSLFLQGGAVVAGLATLATAGVTTVGGDGSAVSLRGGLAWSNTGLVAVGGNILILSPTTFVNQAGGRFALATDAAGIIADTAKSTFANAGLLEKTGGAGVSEIDSTLTDTGTISVALGTLLVTGNAALGGVLSGPGTLELAGGSNQITGLSAAASSDLMLASGIGATLSGSTLGAFAVTQGELVVIASSTVDGHFAQTGGSLYLGGQVTLALDGGASIQGGAAMSGAGTLATGGATTIAADLDAVSIVNLAWSNTGGVSVDGVIDSSGTVEITNAVGATFGFGANAAGIHDAAGKSTFANAGTLANLAGAGISVVDSVLTSTGVIMAAAGTLDLDGGGTIAGAIGGGGTLLFGGGNFSIAAGTAIGVATLAVSTGTVSIAAGLGSALSLSGGSVALQAASNTAARLTLSAASLDLANGATLHVTGAASLAASGTIDGPGRLITSGATTIAAGAGGLVLAGHANWTDRGAVTALGTVQNAGGGTITLGPAGSFDLAADGAGVTGGDDLVNNGALAKTAGAGISTVDAVLTSTGTITVASGTLDLDGGGTISGALGGGGTLLFGGGDFAVAGTTALGVGNLAIDAGAVTFAAPASGSFGVAGAVGVSGGTLNLSGGALSLSGPVTLTDGGGISGAATLATSGSVTIAADGSSAAFGNGLTWNNSGTVSVSGQIQSAGLAAVVFSNTAGGTFDFASDAAGITDDGSVSTFDNAGALAKTGGSGESLLFTSVYNTGTLLAASGTLALEFSATLGGVAGGVDGGTLLLVNGATTTGPLAISDDGSAVSVQVSSSYAEWSNTGTVADGGQVLLGDSTDSGPSILYNAAGASWNLTTADAGISAQGQALFTNAGTLAKTGGDGDSVVTFGFANTGLIDAASGTLTLQGAVSGVGALRIEAGSTLELGAALASGQSLTMAGSGATLKLDQPASVAGPIQGLGAGSGIDLAGASVTGASVAGDVLSVTAGASSYTFTSSQSLAGLSAQATSDGSGGSLVTLTTANLALAAADFLAAAAEPTAADAPEGGLADAIGTLSAADTTPALPPMGSTTWLSGNLLGSNAGGTSIWAALTVHAASHPIFAQSR